MYMKPAGYAYIYRGVLVFILDYVTVVQPVLLLYNCHIVKIC